MLRAPHLKTVPVPTKHLTSVPHQLPQTSIPERATPFPHVAQADLVFTLRGLYYVAQTSLIGGWDHHRARLHQYNRTSTLTNSWKAIWYSSLPDVLGHGDSWLNQCSVKRGNGARGATGRPGT